MRRLLTGNHIPMVAMALAALAADVAAQAVVGQPRFEVASVKPVRHDSEDPAHSGGGPGTDDPERIRLEQVSLLGLITLAYRPDVSGSDPAHSFDWDQISGPAWLGPEHFRVDAKVAPGTTKAQLKLMWRNLLAERFNFKAHFTTKEFTVYALSVGKNGPKLRKAGEGPEMLEPGFPAVVPGTRRGKSTFSPRTIRYTFRGYSMAEFAGLLGWPLSGEDATFYEGFYSVGRVVDKTGLDGLYDFTLEFAGWMAAGGAFPPPLPDGEADTAPTLFGALEQQLGLKLEKTKAKLDVLVIDHVDRVPTEN